GLHWKIPFVDTVRKFDARVLTIDATPESFYTVERKRLIVDSYAKYRVVDAGTYYRATGGDEFVARNRMAARINDGLRNEFGTRTLVEVVSGQRDSLMEKLTTELNTTVRESLGVEVLDVRVKRIDLPPEISGDVYNRMRAEREVLAREFRSEGEEEATKIRADADRQRVLIEAEAYRESETIRGEGDAQAAAIYAEAYNKDAEFFAFVRSLEAYKESFGSPDSLLVIDPQSDFFKYLKDAQGGREQ
ncbi:MAG: protease modulator HflC, partial [Pseudomonadales bacterium]